MGNKLLINIALINGKIYTLEGFTAEAVAVSGEKIAAIGSTEEILKLCSSTTEIINLSGRCLLPGFNDSHMHFIAYGMLFDRIDLKNVTSIEEIINVGRKFIKQERKEAGAWIIGYGFDQNLFPEKTLPQKGDIDKISDVHPILVDRICGHVGAANTLALETVGVTKDTVIEGGIIGKDEHGNLTGVLYEAALDWFKSCIPKPETEKIKDVIKKTAKEALALGLTSIQTDDLETTGFDTMLEAYQSLDEEGELTIRINEEIQAARPEKLQRLLDTGLRTGSGSNYFRIGNVKLLIDGSLGAGTAGMRQGYSDDQDNKGVLVYSQEELNEIVGMAHHAGMQIAFHAIGDAAIELCINAVEKAMKDETKQLRHRIVHCQIADENLFIRMARLGIGADIQPSFVASDYKIVESKIGEERGSKSYAWKTMLNCGVHLGGGSDCPVEDCNPIFGIYFAVNRQDSEGEPIGGWLPFEKLSALEAVKLYTIDAAYLSFEENIKGTIKEGKLADMIVLSEDIFEVKPEKIKDIEVLLTMVGGKIQYQRNK